MGEGGGAGETQGDQVFVEEVLVIPFRLIDVTTPPLPPPTKGIR
jgi:hypothetical protein